MPRSQEALTSAAQQLQTQVQSLMNELNTVVPTFTDIIVGEIKLTRDIVDTVNARISVIDGKLEVELSSLMSIGAATKIQQLMDFTQKVSSANNDGKLQVLNDATEEFKMKMEKLKTTDKTIAAITGRLGATDTKVNVAVDEIAKVEGNTNTTCSCR